MQTTLIPLGVCNKLEGLIHRFLWGCCHKERACHLVRWDHLLQPKKLAGLGFRSLHNMNLAFMAKLGWQILIESDALWVQVLRTKYVLSCQTSSNTCTHKTILVGQMGGRGASN